MENGLPWRMGLFERSQSRCTDPATEHSKNQNWSKRCGDILQRKKSTEKNKRESTLLSYFLQFHSLLSHPFSSGCPLVHISFAECSISRMEHLIFIQGWNMVDNNLIQTSNFHVQFSRKRMMTMYITVGCT